MWKEAVKNSSIILLGVVLSRFFIFFYNLVIIRHLSVGDYARFSFALVVFNWVLILSHVDLYAVISKKTSEFRVLGDSSRIQSYFKHARLLAGGFSCIGVVVAFGFISQKDYHSGYLLMFLASLLPLAQLTINDGYFKGFEKFSFSAIVETVSGLSRIVILAGALLLVGRLSLNMIFGLFLFASVVAFSFSSYLLRMSQPQGHSFPLSFSTNTAGSLLHFSKWVCLTDLMSAGILLSGNLILSYHSVEHLAQFNLVILFFSVFQICFGSITTVLIPQVSRIVAKNVKFELLGIREFCIICSGAIFLISGILFFPYQVEVIQFLFAKTEYQETFKYLAVLLVAIPFRVLTMTNKGIVQGIGRPGLIAMASVVTLFTHIVLFIPFYVYFELTGAFVAMVLGYLVEFIVTRIVARKTLQSLNDSPPTAVRLLGGQCG